MAGEGRTICGIATVVAVALALAPGNALASKSCGHVSTQWQARASVKVKRGHVSCREARRVARTLLNGKARYHDNGYTFNSYWTVRKGWRGQYHTGNWYMKNRRRHALIRGRYS